MVDIVERLRVWPAAYGEDAMSSTYVGEMAKNAADEIERMRNALKRISNGGTSVLISAVLDECPVNPDVLEQIVKDAVAGLGDAVGKSLDPK